MALTRGKKKAGVRVGRTESTRRERVLQRHKATRATMGLGVPRASEGAVGDITVRKITTQGLRCYIKTGSGWIDINTMQSVVRTEWIPMVLDSSWVRYDTTHSEPAYFKDERGFVHLRGGIKGGSGITATICTLPPGFRPGFKTIIPAATTSVSTAPISVKILSSGVVNFNYGGDTGLSHLDGISFYAAQKIIGQGVGGGGGSGSGGGGGAHGGGGA